MATAPSDPRPFVTNSAATRRELVRQQQHHSGIIKRGFLNALEKITAAGEPAFFEQPNDELNPGLHVNGVGDLTLPLRESDAQALISLARQAPYGKGTETLVDTAVRNTWESDPTQFSFTNTGWDDCVSRICARVSQRLGVGAPVRSEIYKMLIYEKGAMFKAHTDTEKIPGMFGTLVICLPSPHDGGGLVIKHAGQILRFETSVTQPSIACWYSDVTHEVLPVTSGYRWVLTYNLAIDPSQPRPMPDINQSELVQLRSMLKTWLAADAAARPNKWLYHVLEHDYTEASVSLETLKRTDQAVVRALKSLSDHEPVEIFIALLEKMEMGDCEGYGYGGHYDDSEDDEDGFHHIVDEPLQIEYQIKSLIDLEGQSVSQEFTLEQDDILQEDCFEDLDAEEEYEGYMGNSGPSVTHWYRTTAVVMVPKDSINVYFNQIRNHGYSSEGMRNISGQVRYLANASQQRGADKHLKDALILKCTQAWEYQEKAGVAVLDEGGIHNVMKMAVVTGDVALLEKAAKCHFGALSAKFFQWLRMWLLEQDDVEQQWNMISSSIMLSLSRYTDVTKMQRALLALAHIKPDSHTQDNNIPEFILSSIRSHLESITDDYLDSARLGGGFSYLNFENGCAMVDLTLYLEEPLRFLENLSAKILVKRDYPSFILGFLSRLHSLNQDEGVLKGKTRDIYIKNARQFVTTIDFARMLFLRGGLDANVNPHHPRISHHRVLPNPSPRHNVMPEKLTAFVVEILQLETEKDLADSLFTRIMQYKSEISTQALESLWVPFLGKLSFAIDLTSLTAATTVHLRQTYMLFVQDYITRFIGREPMENRNLVRQRVDCNCGDCLLLNAFLASATEKQWRFAVNKQRRQHLHRILDSARVDCTHETERIGSPQRLVVTKTFNDNLRKHKEWRARKERAIGQLQNFDQDKIRVLLEDDYERTWDMNHLFTRRSTTSGSSRRVRHLTSNARAAASSSANHTASEGILNPTTGNQTSPASLLQISNQVAGQKRRRPLEVTEVIGLTDD